MTSNLDFIKEVTIRITFCIAGIIYYTCSLVIDIQFIHYNKRAFNKRFYELCVKITLLRYVPKKILTVCNAVNFRLCIDLMHILPPVTAEGYGVAPLRDCFRVVVSKVVPYEILQ